MRIPWVPGLRSNWQYVGCGTFPVAAGATLGSDIRAKAFERAPGSVRIGPYHGSAGPGVVEECAKRAKSSLAGTEGCHREDRLVPPLAEATRARQESEALEFALEDRSRFRSPVDLEDKLQAVRHALWARAGEFDEGVRHDTRRHPAAELPFGQEAEPPAELARSRRDLDPGADGIQVVLPQPARGAARLEPVTASPALARRTQEIDVRPSAVRDDGAQITDVEEFPQAPRGRLPAHAGKGDLEECRCRRGAEADEGTQEPFVTPAEPDADATPGLCAFRSSHGHRTIGRPQRSQAIQPVT